MVIFYVEIRNALVNRFGGGQHTPNRTASGPHPDAVPAIEPHPARIQLTDAIDKVTEAHAAEIARIEQRHAVEAQSHADTHAKDQKTIERLTTSNAAKDAEIARLKEQIPKPAETPRAPRRIEGTPYIPKPYTFDDENK